MEDIKTGETYMTKMAVKWQFIVDKIDRHPQTNKIIKLYGRYTHSQELTNCPIDPERLIIPDLLAEARKKAQSEMSEETKAEMNALSKKFCLEDNICPHCKNPLI